MNFLTPSKLCLIVIGILCLSDVKSQDNALLLKSTLTNYRCFRKPPKYFITAGAGVGNQPNQFVDDVRIRVEEVFGEVNLLAKNHFYLIFGKRLRFSQKKLLEIGVGARVENYLSQFTRRSQAFYEANKSYVTSNIATNYTYYFFNSNFGGPLISGGLNLQFNNAFYKNGFTLLETEQKGEYIFTKPTPVNAIVNNTLKQKAPYFIIPQAKFSIGYEYKLKYMKHIRVMLTTEVELLKSSQLFYEIQYSDEDNIEFDYFKNERGMRRVYFSLSFTYLFGK